MSYEVKLRKCWSNSANKWQPRLYIRKVLFFFFFNRQSVIVLVCAVASWAADTEFSCSALRTPRWMFSHGAFLLSLVKRIHDRTRTGEPLKHDSFYWQHDNLMSFAGTTRWLHLGETFGSGHVSPITPGVNFTSMRHLSSLYVVETSHGSITLITADVSFNCLF